MVRRDKPYGPLLAALLMAATLPALARAELLTRHVVIVVIDGGRYSETLGDPLLTWHPRIGNDLSAIGARPSSFWNLGQTVTVPGMSALICGRWQNLANDGTERPHWPTLCEYLRAATGDPDSAAMVVGGKTKLAVLTHSDHPDYGAAFAGVAIVGFPGDVATFTAARSRLVSRRPKFMIVNLGDTDIRGHQSDWPGYLAAIQQADSLVWELWSAIQADSGLAGKTTLFVTNDHGRHDAAHGGFSNHGDRCGGCQRIELVVAGPDTRPGFIGVGAYDQTDLARTSGHLLGIPMPHASGRVMEELLIDGVPTLSVPLGGAADGALALKISPNPARGPVQLALRGIGATAADIEVLDMAGRIVARVRSSEAASSTGLWTWDGRSTDGRETSPGLYFVRASTLAGRSVTARIVRLR